MNYEPILNNIISAVSHPLKSGLDLELALKAKLTKKEFKLLKNMVEPIELSFGEDEIKRVETNLKKKLNQERVKQELYAI